MGVRIIPFTANFETEVKRFNQRLAAGGSEFAFPESHIPAWLPPGLHPTLYNELFVAAEDDGQVRGAYVLKHQDFLINGEVINIANYSLPLSEGTVDKRFGLVGVSLILDAQRRKPNLFDLGIGGMDQPSARVMKGAGWSLIPVPFYFRVNHPFPFLRELTYVRNRASRRLLLDTLAFSGLGWLGHRVWTLMKRRPPRAARPVVVTVVREFGDWADALWQAAGGEYRFVAVRDRAVLDALYPAGNDRFIRLRISEGDRTVGWVVLLDTQMRDHKQFGSMRLGSIADCFAAPSDAATVIGAADEFLARRGVDLIVTNQSHRAWCEGLRQLGYSSGPSNFIFTASKPVAKMLEPFEEAVSQSHINRGDGDGPINL
jgi:hypothetical protein